ncbi:MAG: helix-turn-helix transcriptional regulator [Clostridia bacterium]|nr:helix-turn-helix transcriptional regulator [Clostridia bacterium]
MQVCQRLREIRKARGLSQTDVARALDILYQQYARYEKGERQMPLNYFIALAGFYGVTLDYLAGLSDDEHTAVSSTPSST